VKEKKVNICEPHSTLSSFRFNIQRKEIHMDDYNQYKLETFEEYLFSKSFLEYDDDIDISDIRQLSSITQELINNMDMEAAYE